MPDYAWPDAQHRTLIGARVTRVDAPVKVSGQAKYTYDVHRPGMLYGKVLRSPYAHAKVVSIDTSAAEKMPGVKAIHIVQGPGSTIHWAGASLRFQEHEFKTRTHYGELQGANLLDWPITLAEMTGRVCCGLELNPAYVDVVVRRWQLFTEREARHRASGQSFDERAAAHDRDQSGSAHG